MARPKSSKNKQINEVEQPVKAVVNEPNVADTSVVQKSVSEENTLTVSGSPANLPRIDPMKPVHVGVNDRAKPVGGMGLGLKETVNLEKVPPYSRSELKAKGFIR